MLRYLTASITTEDLSMPTTPTHIKYRSTVLTANFFEKYNIHTSGLANSRKKKYIDLNLCSGLPAAYGCPKKGPKLLLRAFYFSWLPLPQRVIMYSCRLSRMQEEKEPNPKKKNLLKN
jgi:hypothetical protein